MKHGWVSLCLVLATACNPTPPELGTSQEALTVCPGPETVKGIDVSEWQGAIDWGQVAGAGYTFAIARINDGHHMDPYFQGHWAGIKNAGLIRGAYQFYEPTISASTQAQWVIDAVGMLGPGDLPVMLDVEWTSGTPNAAGIGAWLAQVEAGTGKRPLIYTAVGYWNQYFTTQFGDYDLVVANYGVNCPSMPSSWNGWFMWQWGGAPVPGISGDVDQDVFNGNLTDLQVAAGQHAGSGCNAGNAAACGRFGCGCVQGQCSGGFCPGTGCAPSQATACGAFGCNCVDQACNGGFCAGPGCTAKEINDCAKFGTQCVDHQCSGGFASGTGCTAKETNDCAAFGCTCVDHQCNGGACPGTGCTAKQVTDCGTNGKDCLGGTCVARDGGTPAPPDGGELPPPDAGLADAGSGAEPDAGTPPGAPDAGNVPPPVVTAGCGCSAGGGADPLALVLVYLGAMARRRRQLQQRR